MCPNKKTWRKWNSWKTADTRKFPAGILWLRLSRGTDAVGVAFSISEFMFPYLGAPYVMGSKPPQPRKGQQSFPFQSLPHYAGNGREKSGAVRLWKTHDKKHIQKKSEIQKGFTLQTVDKVISIPRKGSGNKRVSRMKSTGGIYFRRGKQRVSRLFSRWNSSVYSSV